MNKLKELRNCEAMYRSNLDQWWRSAEEHIDAIDEFLTTMPKTGSVLRSLLTLASMQIHVNRFARQLDEIQC